MYFEVRGLIFLPCAIKKNAFFLFKGSDVVCRLLGLDIVCSGSGPGTFLYCCCAMNLASRLAGA